MDGKEQQHLPGLEAGRAVVVSPSSLEAYRRCPRRYRLLYVDGVGSRAVTPEQAFGISIHATLREFFRLPPAERSLEVLERLFRRAWVRDGYRSREQEEQERERGLEALRAWYGRADTDLVPHATELALSAAFGEVVLKGRLDRVDQAPGGGLAVVDYKTARQAAGLDDADLDHALTIYAALAGRKLGRPVTRLVLDYVVAGVEVVAERPPEVQAERLREVLELAGQLRDDREFAPRTGRWCARCEVLSRCPAGKREVGRPAPPGREAGWT